LIGRRHVELDHLGPGMPILFRGSLTITVGWHQVVAPGWRGDNWWSPGALACHHATDHTFCHSANCLRTWSA
jgi:hypothetical protein